MERSDDEFLRLRESWCELIEDQGLQYNFVSYGQLEQGELLKRGYRVFILPRSSSLSLAEVAAIREFFLQGGTVIADGEPGTFNSHSRRLSSPQLSDLRDGSTGKGKFILLKARTVDYLQDRLSGKEAATHQSVRDLFRSAGVAPEFAVTGTGGNTVVGVETHVFANGGVSVITLMSNPLLRVDELGPPDFRSNKRFETPAKVKLTLPYSMYVYDSRTGKALGQKREIELTVGPYEPVILSASAAPLPKLAVAAPATAKRGEIVEIGLAAMKSPAETHVFHVDVIDPTGVRVDHYSGNLIAGSGRASKLIPLAVGDPVGEWKVRVRDAFTGETKEIALAVE